MAESEQKMNAQSLMEMTFRELKSFADSQNLKLPNLFTRGSMLKLIFASQDEIENPDSPSVGESSASPGRFALSPVGKASRFFSSVYNAAKMTIKRAGAPEVKTTSRDADEDDNDEQKKAKAKREADRKERGKLIEELISSEETFLTHLIVLTDYKNRLRSKLKPEQLKILFPNIMEIIRGLSQKLLVDLKTFWKTFDNDSSKLSEVLLVFMEALSTFSEYSKRYGEAVLLREELEERDDILEITRYSGAGHTLRQYQNVIIQRPPRLKLLIDQIVEKTPEDHPDYEGLVNIQNIIDEANLKIEEDLRKQEDGRALARMAQELGDEAIPSQSKCVMCEGEVQIIREDGTLQDVFMVLFDNRVLYGCYTRKGFEIMGDGKTDTMAFSFSNLPNYKEWENLIRVNTLEHSFLMICESEIVKRMWLRQLELVYNTVLEDHNSADQVYKQLPSADASDILSVEIDKEPIQFPPAVLLMPKPFSDKCCLQNCGNHLWIAQRMNCSKCGIIIGKKCAKMTRSNKSRSQMRATCTDCAGRKSIRKGTVLSPRQSNIMRADMPMDVMISRADDDPSLQNIPKSSAIKISRQEESANSIVEKFFIQHEIDSDPNDYGLVWPDKVDRLYIYGPSLLDRYPRIQAYDPKVEKLLGKVTFTIVNRTALQWHRALTNLDLVFSANTPGQARNTSYGIDV